MAQEMAAVRQEWGCQKPTQLGRVLHSLISTLNMPAGNHIAQERPGDFDFCFISFTSHRCGNWKNSFSIPQSLSQDFVHAWSGK